MALAKLYTEKTAITAADLLNDRVVPFFDEQGIRLQHILTDRGTEYCGKPENHAYQLYLAALGVDMSALGNLAARQLTWLVPSLALMGLSSLAALALVQGTGGALLVGLIWLMQILLRGWFVASPWARYLFLFMRARYTTNPALTANELCLAGLAVALVAAAGWLLRKTERYL